METLQGAMVKSQKAWSDAKTGNEGLAESYAKLGLNLDEMGNSSEAFTQTRWLLQTHQTRPRETPSPWISSASHMPSLLLC